MSNDCCDYDCNRHGFDCPAADHAKDKAKKQLMGDWANECQFYRHGNIVMEVDEPTSRETLLAFLADGWRYILIGTALAAAGACIVLALFLNFKGMP